MVVNRCQMLPVVWNVWECLGMPGNAMECLGLPGSVQAEGWHSRAQPGIVQAEGCQDSAAVVRPARSLAIALMLCQTLPQLSAARDTKGRFQEAAFAWLCMALRSSCFRQRVCLCVYDSTYVYMCVSLCLSVSQCLLLYYVGWECDMLW